VFVLHSDDATDSVNPNGVKKNTCIVFFRLSEVNWKGSYSPWRISLESAQAISTQPKSQIPSRQMHDMSS